MDDINIVVQAITVRWLRRSSRSRRGGAEEAGRGGMCVGLASGSGGAGVGRGGFLGVPTLCQATTVQEKPPDQVTANILCDLANIIAPGMLVMEVDFPSNHPNGKLPILDLEVWVEAGAKVMHCFYKKLMSTKMVVLARSALPASSKRSILIAEALRRLLNCHPDLQQEQKAAYLTEFSVRMSECGHDQHFREVVLKRAVEKYSSILSSMLGGDKQMYRSKEEKAVQKLEESTGKRSKSGWFKSLGYDGVVTVPATIDSTLMEKVSKSLKGTDSPRGYKMLVMEDGGRTISSDIVKANPFPINNCGRSNCSMCSGGGDSGGKCYTSNAVYKFECTRAGCTGEEVATTNTTRPVPTYVGETSRPLFNRAQEHKDLYSKRKPQSAMWRHTEMEHAGVILDPNTDFKFTVLNSHRTALDRILEEAVQIQGLGRDSRVASMNGRMEYYAPQYVRPAFFKGPEEHH